MIKNSFIIPVKAINDYIREAIPKILAIGRDDYEIIIYPDEINDETWPKTRQIATGHCGPAEKRTRAIKDAVGEILVFIDDDAYPANDFLEILDENFKNEKVKAVGGPALTPPDDSFWAKVSGAVFLSALSGGNPERYVPIGASRLVNDWPSVNFSIRKAVFAELGGFASEFWPGEDTKLCLDLIKKYPDGIIYDPKLIAYHHRRPGLKKHLKQIAGYGVHRGFFAKKYPETSCRLKYFIPSLFLLFVIFAIVFSIAASFAALSGNQSFFENQIFLILRGLILGGGALYLLALVKSLLDIRRYEKNILIALNAVYYIFLTHLVYGYNFFKGLIIKNLKSKLR
ncbi:MAG: glycosyltransferase [Patescibacteria group bacterium]